MRHEQFQVAIHRDLALVMQMQTMMFASSSEASSTTKRLEARMNVGVREVGRLNDFLDNIAEKITEMKRKLAVQKSHTPCKFFSSSGCSRGDSCPFLHEKGKNDDEPKGKGTGKKGKFGKIDVPKKSHLLARTAAAYIASTALPAPAPPSLPLFTPETKKEHASPVQFPMFAPETQSYYASPVRSPPRTPERRIKYAASMVFTPEDPDDPASADGSGPLIDSLTSSDPHQEYLDARAAFVAPFASPTFSSPSQSSSRSPLTLSSARTTPISKIGLPSHTMSPAFG